MVSVSSLLAAQRSLQQGNQPRGNTAFKLQGKSVRGTSLEEPLLLKYKTSLSEEPLLFRHSILYAIIYLCVIQMYVGPLQVGTCYNMCPLENLCN